MRIGLVTWWFNRGQATVMRTIRHALDQLGHQTYVLARPTTDDFELPAFVSSDDVWADHHNLTYASASKIPTEEYRQWASANQLDTALFFQNLDFEGIGALRRDGVRTIGTYMWEAFGAEEAKAAAPVFDTIYAMNGASHGWFTELELNDVPLIRFAAHPEVAAARAPARRDGPTSFLFMAGYLRGRKPLGAVLKGFQLGSSNGSTLTIKSQVPVRAGDLVIPSTSRDITTRYTDAPGQAVLDGDDMDAVRVLVDDLPEHEFLAELQRHDVVIGVSRWEGLGLHLYECEALGLPLMLNRMEPYIGFAADGSPTALVESHRIGTRKCGIEIHEPDVESLAKTFDRLSTRAHIDTLRQHPTVPHADRWTRFVEQIQALVGP